MANLATFNRTIADERTQVYLAQVLGEKKSSFVNNLTALVVNNALLQECEPLTLMYAGIKATALDLPLDSNLGFAYVIPYRNNKTGKTEAQFQMGYKGYIQLAMRSGQFHTINVRDVREGEIVDEDFVSGEMVFKKLPSDKRASAPIVGFVAFFELTNGFRKTFYMTIEELKAHGLKYSKTYASNKDYIRKTSKWETDFEAMASKTVIKLLLSKYAPMSVEMQTAQKIDQAVLSGADDSQITYVDNVVVEDNIQQKLADGIAQKNAEMIQQSMQNNHSKEEVRPMPDFAGTLAEAEKNEKKSNEQTLDL